MESICRTAFAGYNGLGNRRDRKSTRLNSSHGYISYAVFCLKKKMTQVRTTRDDASICAAFPIHTAISISSVTCAMLIAGSVATVTISQFTICVCAIVQSHPQQYAENMGAEQALICHSVYAKLAPIGITMIVEHMSIITMYQFYEKISYYVMMDRYTIRIFFFLNSPATPDISFLPLHDPVPI